MVLKFGGTQGQVKGGRGLAYDANAYLARDQIIFIPVVAVPLTGQPLMPGQETEVVVTVSNLRPNADVKRMRATLHVFTDAPLAPAPTTVQVKEGDGPDRTFVISTAPAPGLSNVSIRLNPGETFWEHSGTLAPGSHPIPVDLAEHVNAYLDATAHSEGIVTLSFMIKTDAPGRVRVDIDTVDLTQLQTQTWLNELDGTLRADRTLTLDFQSETRLPLSAIAPLDGRAPALVRITMDLSGQIGPERALETAGDSDGGEFGTVGGDHALARGFVLDQDTVRGGLVRCTGFSMYLRQDAEVELYAEVQVDATQVSPAAHGRQLTTPAASEPLARANAVITPQPEWNGRPGERWVAVRFDSPADLRVGLPYWLVIQGVRGTAYVGLRRGDERAPGRPVREERLRINRGGRIWKGLHRETEDPTHVRISLVYVPGPDNGLAAVEVTVETGAPGSGTLPVLADPGPRPQTVSLDVGGRAPQREAVLVVRSHAAGTCAIANVIQEYATAEPRDEA